MITKRKKLIFHIGCNAGFFSEYLGMIFAIAYCKINDISFSLYSKDANFGISKGWIDYFKPFCDETDDDFHSWMNRRIPFPSIKQYVKSFYKKIWKKQDIPSWFWDIFKPYMIKQYFLEPYYKHKYGFNYYTFELWNSIHYEMNPALNYSILSKQINIKDYTGNLSELYKEIIRKTWRYNDSIQEKMAQLKSLLNLPEKYIGMHIRQGDKILENVIYSWKDYFDVLHSISPVKENSLDIFMLTDDYTIIEEIRYEYPNFRIFTFCDENDRGYINSAFQEQTPEFKQLKLIKLFLSIDILCHSEIFVGVFNSSPDLFIEIVRDKPSYYVDFKK